MTQQASCPSCGIRLDPTRAPLARIRGGRVVTFCSARCADAPAQAAGPPAAAAAPRRSEPAANPSDSYEALELYDASPAPDQPRRRRLRLVLAAAAVMVLGIAIAIVAVLPEPAALAPATSVSTSEAVHTSSEPQEPPPATPEVLRTRARAALEAMLQSSSPRLQRIAARALARLDDPQALALLDKRLTEEPSELDRVEIAYVLARSGRDKGVRVLHAALEHPRRDVRLDASRYLVELGDEAGKRHLRSMLRIRTQRIGAAEVLARAGDEEAMEVLRELLATADESPEIKMRAAVALGRAGDGAVKDELVEILENPTFHVGAADALAALGEPVAAPALERQLASVSMRVQAALALRRLGQHVDLTPLAVALARGDEAGRQSAAEAILILTGPERVAEHD